MFILGKLISRILFPVALIIELIIAGMILLLNKQRRSGYCVCIIAIVLLILASMHPVADSLLWTLEGQYHPIVRVTPELKKKVDYIVVLGGGHSERDQLSATTRLSPSSNGRVAEAVRLSREFPSVPLIFTGGIVEGKTAIGEAASRAAVGYGLHCTRVIIERLARNTAEEAKAVSSLVGGKKVLLVTSASHMRRAMSLFKAAGMNPVPAPADFQAMGGPYSPWDYIPSADALHKTESVWYEYMGIAWNVVRDKFL